METLVGRKCKIAALLVLVALSGCATVYRVASKPQTFAACKVVDVGSTIAILNGGGAENNPLMKAVIGTAPYSWTPFILVSAALVGIVWYLDKPPVTAVATAVTCPAAAHNMWELMR